MAELFSVKIRIADIEEVRAVIESAVELNRLIRVCDDKFQIDNSVELHLFRNALEGLAEGPAINLMDQLRGKEGKA